MRKTNANRGIVRDPEIMVGKPTIAGTRITVELILRRLAEGLTIVEITDDYPHLSVDQVRAAIDYAANAVSVTKPRQAHVSARDF